MLEELPPGTLDGWQAYWQVEPDWRHQILKALKVGLLAIAAGVGVQLKPEDLEIKTESGRPAGAAPAEGEFLGPAGARMLLEAKAATWQRP